MDETIRQSILNRYEGSRHDPLTMAVAKNISYLLGAGDQSRRELIASAIDIVTSAQRSMAVCVGCSVEDWKIFSTFFPSTIGWCDDIETAARAISIIAKNTPLHRRLHAAERLSASIIYPSERLMVLLHDRPDCTGWIMELAAFKAMGFKMEVKSYLEKHFIDQLNHPSHNLDNPTKIRLMMLASKLAEEIDDSLSSLHIPVSRISNSQQPLPLDPHLCRNGRTTNKAYVQASEILASLGLCSKPLKFLNPGQPSFNRLPKGIDYSRFDTGHLTFDTTNNEMMMMDSNEIDLTNQNSTINVEGKNFLEVLEMLCQQCLFDLGWSHGPNEIFRVVKDIIDVNVGADASTEDGFVQFTPRARQIGEKPLIKIDWETEPRLKPFQHQIFDMVYITLIKSESYFNVQHSIGRRFPHLEILQERGIYVHFVAAVCLFVAYLTLREGINGPLPRLTSVQNTLFHAINITQALNGVVNRGNINSITLAIGGLYTGINPEGYKDEKSKLITAMQGSGNILLTANPIIDQDYSSSAKGILKYFITPGEFRNSRSKKIFEISLKFGEVSNELGEKSDVIYSVPPMTSVDVHLQAQGNNIVCTAISGQVYRQMDFGFFCIGSLSVQEDLLCQGEQKHLRRAYFVSFTDLILNFGKTSSLTKPFFCSTSQDPVLQFVALSIGGSRSCLVTETQCINCSFRSVDHRFVIPL